MFENLLSLELKRTHPVAGALGPAVYRATFQNLALCGSLQLISQAKPPLRPSLMHLIQFNLIFYNFGSFHAIKGSPWIKRITFGILPEVTRDYIVEFNGQALEIAFVMQACR